MNQRHSVALAILSIAVLLMLSCSGSKEVRKAKEFLDAGMFDQATILLKQEIQTDPKNAEAHMLLGVAYLGQGMNALAEQELNTATVLDNSLTKEAAKRCYDAAKYLVKTDKSKAHAALMKAKELDPSLERDEPFFFLAYIDTEENDIARMEGARKYLTLFPSGPNTAQATYELAEGLMSSGNRDQAKTYYAQLVSQSPTTEWGKKAGNRLADWIEIKELSIPSQTAWYDTGVTLSKGTKLSISASGKWSNGGDVPHFFGPNGAEAPYPGTFVPSANLAALVGKVGDITFAVGESFSGNSPASGKLYLSLNDVPGGFSDNSGVMNVKISYSSR